MEMQTKRIFKCLPTHITLIKKHGLSINMKNTGSKQQWFLTILCISTVDGKLKYICSARSKTLPTMKIQGTLSGVKKSLWIDQVCAWGRQHQLSVQMNLHRRVSLGLCSLYQCFPWFYLGFYAKTPIRTTLSFLEHMLLLPTNFLNCTNQVQMSCCCYLKYLQLEIMGSWGEFSYYFWYPLLSSCCTCHTLCTI